MKNRFSRRGFLRTLTAGTCGAAIHNVISPYDNMLALAQGQSSKVIIVVNMSGGCSYNITPIYHGTYRDKNPTISFSPEDSLPISAEQGLHPSLTGLKSIYDEGRLAVLNMVGYPNPNRSHDESTDIWHRGTRLTGASNGGWGARLTCQMNTIFGGVSLGGTNLITTGDCNPPRSFASLDQNAFGERSLSGASAENAEFLRNIRENVNYESLAPEGADNYNYLKAQNDNLSISLQSIKAATVKALPDITPVTFPNSSFGRSCRDAAKLINAPELGSNFIYLQRGGFDTHAGERAALTGNLNDINGGLTALIASAKAMNRWQDVVIITMSEFCRTFENGSQGTDHGHAAPMLIAGGAVRGGILSPVPTAEETAVRDYYRDYHLDFRGVFHEAVQFLGYDPLPVFPEAFRYSGIGIIG